MEQAREQFAETAKAVSSQSLQTNSENFLRLAEENFGKHPGNFQRTGETPVGELLEAEPADRVPHHPEQEPSAETSRLAAALTDNRKIGQWGEIQLRWVVELAGMTEYCDCTEGEKTTWTDQTSADTDI